MLTFLHARRSFWILVGAAMVFQITYMGHLGDRAYPDVFRAVEHGYGLSQPDVDPGPINSKTILGPMAWYRVYSFGGLGALRLINVGIFLALVGCARRLAATRFDQPTVTFGLFIVLFYPGTHRNVVAGEQDDMLAGLSVVASCLVWLLWSDKAATTSQRSGAAVATGTIMGVGLLFKYWVGTFSAGLLIVLAIERKWTEAFLVGGATVVPFGLLNLIDGGESFRSLTMSIGIQLGYSPWSQILAKSFNTGLVPFLLAATWGWSQALRRERLLFLLVPLPYVAYVLVARDAFAMSYVMMVCMCFWAMPTAKGLVGSLDRTPWTQTMLAGLMILYVLGTTAITQRNFYDDTVPYELGTWSRHPGRATGETLALRLPKAGEPVERLPHAASGAQRDHTPDFVPPSGIREMLLELVGIDVPGL